MHAKNMLLLLASIAFYAYGEPVYVLLLLFSAWVNDRFGRAIGAEELKRKRKRRRILTAAVLFNLSMLLFFKYTAFLICCINAAASSSIPVPELYLPIGISFYTFQAIAYVIDVYRGNVNGQKRFWKVLLYLSFFPQLVAGPIVRYQDMERALDGRCTDWKKTAKGLRRFSVGLSKKVLLANTLGAVADALYGAEFSQINVASAWLGAVSYMLQIYFDFSGYSDMALGMAGMFGFRFGENFRYPYTARTIRDFWKRWHISLTSWFREYVYIPLGGNRYGQRQTISNRLIVFLCTGLWHGANATFLLWGLFHGCFQMLETFGQSWLERRARRRSLHDWHSGRVCAVLGHMYTLLVVCIGFVFFRSGTVAQGAAWIQQMFSGFHFEEACMSLFYRQLTPPALAALTAGILAACPVRTFFQKLRCYEGLSYGFSIVVLLVCMAELASGAYHPFIYFQF